MTRRTKAYLQLLTVAAIWGSAGPIVKFTLQGISPFSFLAYRFFISACIACAFIYVKGLNTQKILKNLPQIALYGILAFSIALSFLFFGYDRSTVLDVTLMGMAGPLVVTAGGVIFFRDQITKREKVGISIAVVGALVNSVLPLFAEHNNLKFTGNILILMFLLSDSAGVLYAKKLARDKISPLTITIVGFIIAALTIIPVSFFVEGPKEVINSVVTLSFSHHLGVWYMALISGLLAYFLAIEGEKSIEVSEAWLFMYLQPLFAIPMAVLWLKEELTPSYIIGAFIIVLGVYIAEKKTQNKKTIARKKLN